MDHQGHGLALDHAIFNVPNKVAFAGVEAPRQANHVGATSVLYPRGVGETFTLVDFEKPLPEGEWNPTVVNHEGFFTDVPGFESLAEGHSAKCLGSLSLARQGKYFYWGYSTDPERLTEPAKDTLINVLHYMRGKRGSLTVPFANVTRQILTVYLDLHKESGYLRGIEEHLPNQLVETTMATYTDRSPAGAAAWIAKYGPFLFTGKEDRHRSERYKQRFEIDADAMALGTPNADRESLVRWIELAGGPSGESRDQALRCLRRYVAPDLVPADGDWSKWYAAQKERIVFVESAGFWWLVDPRVIEAERAAVTPK